jgi:hypothetical protein
MAARVLPHGAIERRGEPDCMYIRRTWMEIRQFLDKARRKILVE